ncbi:hypothetical protein [Alteromonas facilis]|uniref:hypothetical protein n=1 Tax=Alteromonas facilis TaxID=2048004 RepID=UPI000C289CAE|nr:hypothetical protein [Alteromonas facilis]
MIKRSLLATVVALSISAPVLAEDSPDTLCTSAAELFQEGDLEGALEEARWCVTLLEQLQQAQVNQFFPDELEGFSGDELEQQSAMGFQVTSRNYMKGDQSISVSLNSGSTGGAMDAFSALAQLGFQTGGGEKMRIQRRSASLMKDGDQVTLNITMKSGGMLVFETYDVDKDTLEAFAKAFPVADLDDAMK